MCILVSVQTNAWPWKTASTGGECTFAPQGRKNDSWHVGDYQSLDDLMLSHETAAATQHNTKYTHEDTSWLHAVGQTPELDTELKGRHHRERERTPH